jgi:preprotein translocase subunit SecE
MAATQRELKRPPGPERTVTDQMASDTSKSATRADKATAPKNAKASTKPVKASSGKPSKAAEPNFFERIAKYFHNVRVEMRRVVWPDREEVLQSSLVVVVALVFFTLYISIWDQVASFIFITLPNMIIVGR